MDMCEYLIMPKHLPLPLYGGDAFPTHILLLDVMLLKNPVVQDMHSGSAVMDPAAVVYLPGGHLV